MPYKNKEDELAYLQRSRGRRNANARLRYLKNPEKILANNRKWRQENLDKDKKIKKEYYLLHKQAAIDRAKAWKKRNPNKVKAGDAVYRLKNEDKIKVYNQEYNKRPKVRLAKAKYAMIHREELNSKGREYKKSHPEKAREYVRHRRKNDLQFKLKMALRHRLYLALKGNRKRGSAVKNLGCTIQEFKVYIENLFLPGMNWENWAKKGWHLDHKIPLDNFDLTDELQLSKACHFTNLQPLWWRDNIVKSNKIYG